MAREGGGGGGGGEGGEDAGQGQKNKFADLYASENLMLQSPSCPNST
jgi:hypothetical protein